MKSVIRKLFIDFGKEEKWINDMAAKGLNFIDYSFGRYLFEEGAAGEYLYRLELLSEMPSHPESQAYIKFMEETGAECVSTFMRWVYFRKKAFDGAFQVYSDYDSRIKYYKRVVSLVAIAVAVNFTAAIFNLIVGLTIAIERGTYFNIYISLISWVIVIMFLPMLISYLKKIRKMKKEKQFYQ